MAGAENHFFLDLEAFTYQNFLIYGLKMVFLDSKITVVELNHFPATIPSSLKSRDSGISRNRISRFVVFSRTGERLERNFWKFLNLIFAKLPFFVDFFHNTYCHYVH